MYELRAYCIILHSLMTNKTSGAQAFFRSSCNAYCLGAYLLRRN